MSAGIRELKTPGDLKVGFEVLKELRQKLTFESFLEIFEDIKKRDGFKLAGFFDDGECLAVMGYRVLTDFVHGRHLYVDDLVTTRSKRSQGIGLKLLEHAEIEARKLDCEGMRLCTGIENESARKFYERCGWSARSIAFKKRL